MKERILVVGGVAGGATAAARAARMNPQAEVVLFDRDEHISYAACGIPYCLAQRAGCDQLIARTAEQLERSQGLRVMLRHEAVAIDTESGRLEVRDLEGGTSSKEPFDKLIVATGASPFIPPLDGAGAEGVFTLRTLADGIRLAEFLKSRSPERAAIVGAGPIGLEMCEAFTALGMRVTLIELALEIISNLRPEISSTIKEHLVSNGVEVLTETKPLEVLRSGDRARGLATDRGEVLSDMVLLSIGIRPSVSLAATADIETGVRGAIRVDAGMRTSKPGIFAAGDCCTSKHLVSGQEVWLPLGSTARKQGRVAGANAAGGNEIFPGVLGTFIFKCFGAAAGATGLNEEQARASGFDPVEVTVEGDAVPAYYEDRGRLRIRLLADRQSGRLLGAQVSGEITAGIDKRLDVLATAVAANMTASSLENLDLAYAPPFSHAVDLPLVAGTMAARSARKSDGAAPVR